MKFRVLLKKIFIKPETEQPKEYKKYSIDEYKEMSVSDLLDLRHDKHIPVEELDKVLKVLEVKYPPGVCHCRNYPS